MYTVYCILYTVFGIICNFKNDTLSYITTAVYEYIACFVQ